MFVAPDSRGRGVATALVASACRLAAERGADRATAFAAVDNRPSRRLFERVEFDPERWERYAAEAARMAERYTPGAHV